MLGPRQPATTAAHAGVHGIAHNGVGSGEDAVGGLVWRETAAGPQFPAARGAGHATHPESKGRGVAQPIRGTRGGVLFQLLNI